MSTLQRIEYSLAGLVRVLFGIFMIYKPFESYVPIARILVAVLVLMGLRNLLYYVLMARHMVGGKMILFIGMLFMDFGIFSYSLVERPKLFLISYLIVSHFFWGSLNIIKAVVEKEITPTWRRDCMQGILHMLIMAAAIRYASSVRRLVILFCAGIIYSELSTSYRPYAVPQSCISSKVGYYKQYLKYLLPLCCFRHLFV